MARSSKSQVTTTATTLALLEAIKAYDGATAAELVEHTELARSTIHNHLQTLLDEEYLVKEGDTYHVGMKLLNLGEYVRSRKPQFDVARETTKELAESTGLEASLDMEEHGRAFLMFNHNGTLDDCGFEEGRPIRMHCTACGKAILAALPEHRRDEIIERHGLPEQTEHTITDREKLRQEFERVRERGFAINDEESTIGWRCMSRVITYPDERVYGALTLGGPTYIVDEEFDESLRDALFESVAEIEATLSDSLFR